MTQNLFARKDDRRVENIKEIYDHKDIWMIHQEMTFVSMKIHHNNK